MDQFKVCGQGIRHKPAPKLNGNTTGKLSVPADTPKYYLQTRIRKNIKKVTKASKNTMVTHSLTLVRATERSETPKRTTRNLGEDLFTDLRSDCNHDLIRKNLKGGNRKKRMLGYKTYRPQFFHLQQKQNRLVS